MSFDPDVWGPRWKKAASPSTSGDELGELAKDPDPWIRKPVAGNISTPTKTLGDLVRDPATQQEVLDNPACPKHLQMIYNS